MCGLKIFVRSRPAPAGIWEILRHPQTSNSRPYHTISVPNLHLSLCVWKPLKTRWMCFIAGGNLFGGSFQSLRNVLINTKGNKVETSETSSLLLFHVTQLWNRNNTESRRATRKAIASGNQDKWKHSGKTTDWCKPGLSNSFQFQGHFRHI